MQTALVNALVSAVTKFWPQLEPLLLRAIGKLARIIIQRAKDHEFPERWKFAEPVIDGIADELLKLIPADT